MKSDQVMFKADVNQQLARVTDLLVQLLQGANLNNNGAQAADGPLPANKQDIILGRWYAKENEAVLNIAEKYNMLGKKSILLPPMNQQRGAAACCI